MSSGIAIDVWNGIAVHVIRCLTHFKRHTLLYCFCMTRPDGEMKNLPLQYFNADKSFVTAQKLSVHNYSKWHTQIAPNDSDRSGKGHDGEECGQLPHHVDIAWSMDFFLQSTVDWCEHVAVSCGSPIGHIIVWHEKFICFCNGFYTLQYCISRYIYLCHFLFCVTSARLFQHLRKLILLCTSDTAVERVNSMHWVNVVCVFLERERKTLCVRVCALEYEHVVCALRCCCFFSVLSFNTNTLKPVYSTANMYIYSVSMPAIVVCYSGTRLSFFLQLLRCQRERASYLIVPRLQPEHRLLIPTSLRRESSTSAE